MADNTTTRIVEVVVNTTDAVKGIAAYKLKLDESKKAEKELQAAMKEKDGATDANRQKLVEVQEAQKTYKREIQALSKEVQNNIKFDREKEGSLQSLKAALSSQTAEYNKLSAAERSSANGNVLSATISDTTQKLKDAEEELGNFHRSVGNYEKASLSLRTEVKQLTEALVHMKMEGRENSDEYREMSLRAAELNDAMGDVSQQTRGLASDTASLDVMTQAAQGMAGAWGLYNSTLGASIEEDSEAAEVMKNLQIAMTALTSLTALQNSLQKQSIMMQTITNTQAALGVTATNLDSAAKSKNIIVSTAATAAQWLLNAAAAANPYVLLAIAVLTVVGALALFAGGSAKARQELAALNSEVDSTKKKLDNLAADTDFEVRIAEAMGKSEREVLDIKRNSAKKQLTLADNSMRDIQRAYDAASKKEKKEMQKKYDEMLTMQTQAHEQMAGLNKEYTILEINERKEAEDAKIEAGKKAADLRQQQRAAEFSAVREQIDAEIALMQEGAAKQLASENETHRRKIEDLKKRLDTEKTLTATAKAAINKQIEIADQQHAQNIDALDAKALSDQMKRNEDMIVLKLAAVKKGSDEEFALKLEQLDAQKQAELTNAQLTADEKLLIEQKYTAEAQALRDQQTNTQIQQSQDAMRLEFENKINEAALNHQNTLQLELEYRKAELDSLQQMEGESDAQFKARLLEAQNNHVAAKQAINDYEVEIEQVKLQAMSDITGSLGGLFEELGEDSKAFAMLSKVITLAQIAIDTGRAISAGVANAMAMPFPANIAAVATTVATVIANITSAIKTVKSAKFAQGGYVSGDGTGTSDSISARLSNGESVNNAASTSMFTPIYSTLNQLGGGVPIVAAQSSNQVAGEDMLARAVAKGVSTLRLRVGVDEVQRVTDRVNAVESLGNL